MQIYELWRVFILRDINEFYIMNIYVSAEKKQALYLDNILLKCVRILSA